LGIVPATLLAAALLTTLAGLLSLLAALTALLATTLLSALAGLLRLLARLLARILRIRVVHLELLFFPSYLTTQPRTGTFRANHIVVEKSRSGRMPGSCAEADFGTIFSPAR
jgi:hypothetical protein